MAYGLIDYRRISSQIGKRQNYSHYSGMFHSNHGPHPIHRSGVRGRGFILHMSLTEQQRPLFRIHRISVRSYVM